jgi:hypothetical protein
MRLLRHLNSLALLAPVALASVAGCVDIQKTRVRTTEEVTASVPRVSADRRFTAESSLQGTVLRVRVTPRCDEVAMETVVVSDVSDKYLDEDERLLLTLLALVGAAPLGTGTGLLVDAPNVYDSDENQRLYNQTGKDAAIAAGVILVSVGLAATLPPMINGFRAVGESSEDRTIERQGATLREDVPCAGAELSRSYNVTVRLGTEIFSLGVARPNDPFDVDLLASVVPRLRTMTPPPRGVAVWVDDKFQREFPVDALLIAVEADRQRDDETSWAAAEPSSCQANKNLCEGVRAYLVRFPSGFHAEEARRLLGQAGMVVASGGFEKIIQGALDARDAAQAAAEGEAQATFDRAITEAVKRGQVACRAECARACKKDARCKQDCEQGACQ